MDPASAARLAIRRRRADERGEPFGAGSPGLALLYPSPYAVGMSSLGYQWVGHLLDRAGFGVERAFLPSPVRGRKGPLPIWTEEGERPLGDLPLVAISLATEEEIAGVARALLGAGIPPLRRDRTAFHPRVLLGGPLTCSNPRPAAPFADLILLGEVEPVLVPAVRALLEAPAPQWRDAVRPLSGAWIPDEGPPPPPWEAVAPPSTLPARARLYTPRAELSGMFLVEGERGCPRRCRFCTMRRHEQRPTRWVPVPRVLDAIPPGPRRVGLVGAAIGDHPGLPDLLTGLLDQEREVGVSAMRADRLAHHPELARLLRQAGQRTLTVASDAPSQRLRDFLQKGITEEHLLTCAELAREHGFTTLKVYMMLGLPHEEDADLADLAAFSRRLSRIHPVTMGVSPFVPKPGTPLAESTFAGVPLLEQRFARLRRDLEGAVELRAASTRWAWVESVLAKGTEQEGEAVLEAVRHGGRFADFRRAFGALGHRPAAPPRDPRSPPNQ